MSKGKIFQEVAPARVPRSSLDLSYEKKFTCDMGQIIPILAEEAIPGDVWDIANRAVVRFQPLLAPVLHEVSAKTYYFFVPYRLLDDAWESFISRGVQGTTVGTLPVFDPADYTTPANVYAQGTLWDFLGFPLLQPATEFCPMDYPRAAYYFIYNEYFRDETLTTALDLTPGVEYAIKNALWSKGYFESALPWQQRGTAPALPVFGSASVDFAFNSVNYSATAFANLGIPVFKNSSRTNPNDLGAMEPAGAAPLVNPAAQVAGIGEVLSDSNTVDGSTFTASDISDLRLAVQLQVWMERNARAGVRYTEFLKSHFQVSPTDARLQRPEFIGGTVSPVLFSEVLQTSATDNEPTPQGTLAGHGISVLGEHAGRYRVEEFGLIMGLMVVRPKPAYQDGINRQWLRRTTFDFYFPEFSGLSEQEIFNGELCTRDVAADPVGAANLGVFGYTGRYNEMRYKPDMVCSEMRTTFDYWHLGRQFNPASPPSLNAAFLECVPRKDIFAVPSVPGLIVSFGNILNVLRPMPFMAEPASLFGG